MKQCGGGRDENIHPEIAATKEEVSLSYRTLEKFKTLGEKPG